ncbi:hypothetical protein MHPYR_20173 [uncultured Mycobacterium sp.]|uniref:Uncharacterized protein n=1 Tax=uncultured Mycobacterium sp. TaxID=171292 RepID=A0A1Y5PFL8_9MYCO|nr:hypothetical protein MHPYR_20173 [uncultured Mycobacterium sp.]
MLPESHCLFKLGGQVSFAQQLDLRFFGTTVQTDHELAFSDPPVNTLRYDLPRRGRSARPRES